MSICSVLKLIIVKLTTMIFYVYVPGVHENTQSGYWPPITSSFYNLKPSRTHFGQDTREYKLCGHSSDKNLTWRSTYLTTRTIPG